MDPAIQVRDLSKVYQLYRNPWNRFRERLPWVKEKLHREIPALRDVTFDVPPGTCVGLIGANGAGKSTLLKILTGTTFPSSGSYTIRGRTAALLELGAGFNKDFTGRENIFMNAALMGFSRKEAKKKFHEILEFSELHEFIKAPIRTYSSGMVCRLGFSVAVAVDPDVLIIDEILAVGDAHFRRKCAERILSYKKRGKTMFFCSHSLYDVRQICDRAIWMKDGQMRMFDDSKVVTNEYSAYSHSLDSDLDQAEPWNEDSGRPKPKKVEDDGAHAKILSAEIIDPKTRKPRNKFAPREDVAVRVHIRNGTRYEPLSVAVGFARADGTLCMAVTSEFDKVLIEAEEAVVTLMLPQIKLLSGDFVVPVWLLDEKGLHRFDERPCKKNLIILNKDKELGLFVCERRWDIEVVQPAPTGLMP
ncbi:MAG: polysaccharide ABC transporter ATP-binding protein [Planctomycetota bacterium]